MKGRELTPQLSQSSVLSLADSHTEFFDACEVLLSASSSENEVREEEAGSQRGGTWARWGRGSEIARVPSHHLGDCLWEYPDLLNLHDPRNLFSQLAMSYLILWSLKPSSGDPISALMPL